MMITTTNLFRLGLATAVSLAGIVSAAWDTSDTAGAEPKYFRKFSSLCLDQQILAFSGARSSNGIILTVYQMNQRRE
jgi:hypothetical protein